MMLRIFLFIILQKPRSETPDMLELLQSGNVNLARARWMVETRN